MLKYRERNIICYLNISALGFYGKHPTSISYLAIHGVLVYLINDVIIPNTKLEEKCWCFYKSLFISMIKFNYYYLL